jgi:hypothetical protein
MGTTFTDFRVMDYTDSEVLSTYALSSTPLLFVPEFNIFEEKKNRVVWDFGDGTISRSTSAYKFYTYPGKYTVQMIVYDCYNNALKSTFEKDIVVIDFKPLTFDLDVYSKYDVYGNELPALSANTNPIVFKNGKISGPFVFTVTYPYYQTALNLYYTVSGSSSDNYVDLETNKYAHLDNTYSFYDKIYNYAISSYQYRHVEKIIPETTSIFAKIDGNQIVICKSSDDGAFFVGLTGTKSVYFKDDQPKDELGITFKFDKTGYNSKGSSSENFINNLGITTLVNVLENEPYSLSITSNGLDGEGYAISSFKINPIKLYNTKIPFVIKMKDAEWYSVKNFDNLELSALNISLSAVDGSWNPLSAIDTTLYTISSLNTTLSAQNHGSSFRGYILFTESDSVLENVVMYANTTLTTDTSSYYLSAKSTPFSVYPDNYYDLYKINENFDATQTLRDITFQEIILESTKLYDDFFAGILGDENADHDAIGLKVYERIANFVDNASDVDRCTLEALESLCQNIGYNDKNEEKYVYPEKIKRLLDLLSIDKNRLFGTSNKFADNFDTKGLAERTKYGLNLGSQIDTATYIVSAGTDIVALEKFSNKYTRLNTYQPVSAMSAFHYALSAYSTDWGWPLVLPGVFDFADVGKYYIFFTINERYDNTIMDVVADFYNTRTTILSTVSKNDLIVDGGIYDNMFINTLYKSLSLID